MEIEGISLEQIPQKCQDVMQNWEFLRKKTSLVSMFVVVWGGPIYLNVTFFDFPKS